MPLPETAMVNGVRHVVGTTMETLPFTAVPVPPSVPSAQVRVTVTSLSGVFTTGATTVAVGSGGGASEPEPQP